MKKNIPFLLTVVFLTAFLTSEVLGSENSFDSDSLIVSGDSVIVSKDSISVPEKQNTKETIVRAEKFTLGGNRPANINLKHLVIGKSSVIKRANIRLTGYARAFVQYRVMSDYYPGQTPKSLTLNGIDVKDANIVQTGINNLGYPEPMIYLRLETSPAPQTSILVDYYFDNQLIGSNTSGKISTAYRYLQFTTSTRTGFGTFKLIGGGGVNWYKLSPFTLWGNEFRDDMFERYPWEPEVEGTSYNRYDRYYNTQNISRDARWGNTGTQGFILEGSNLPGGFSATILYGKVDNSGAFTGFQTQAPRNMVSGRLDKTFGKLGKHKIGANVFDQFGYVNSLEEGKLSQKIFTGDLRLNFRGINLFSEIGAGQYKDPIYDFGWGKAINVQAEFDKSLFKIPGMIQFYYIDKSVINVNSSVMNSSHPNLQAAYGVGDSYTITTYQGVLPEFGMLTNNRTGVYLKLFDSFLKTKRLKVILSTGASREIDHLDDQVTLYHRANGFPRSRFTYFQNYVGPYNRIMSIFRRTFEHFTITDSNYTKGFNVLDLTVKYKFKIIGRDLIFINYMTYNSVRNGLSPVPTFNDKAYYRQFYEELMSFCKLTPKFTVIGFFGIEKIVGNNKTEVAANGKYVDQTSIGYGAGFDYDYSPRAGFHFRHRWFSHDDRNFDLDKFRGQETSLELKVFF